MDPVLNPYSPGAGSPPPELVGRAEILESARILLERVRARRAEKSMLLTGLRGVGKTVLLAEISKIAEQAGYRTIFLEASEEKPLASLLVPQLRSLLFDLDRGAGAGHKAKRALKVLKSFLGGIKISYGEVTVGIDIEPEAGTADSGDLEIDLPPLLVAIAEAAEERGTGVALLIDELHYFKENELAALIMAMHRLQQRQLPLVLVGAGLPTLPSLAGDAKSYAERLFNSPRVGVLSRKDAAQALRDPAQEAGVLFEDQAIEEIYELTHGYPYFIQEWGYQVWNTAESSPIARDTVDLATKKVVQRLDDNFFRVRYDRLSPSEKKFLRAMAEIGPGPYRTGEIADVMKVKVTSMGPTRSRLITKGMIYSPTHGELAFTVPLFDQFMKRAIPDWSSI